MILKVRNHPTKIYYVTGDDARDAHEAAHDNLDGPCFVTESFGEDGWTWPTAEEFESDWADGPGSQGDATVAEFVAAKNQKVEG